MSIRKYSTDNEYTNEHIGFNRAMLLSESQSLCTDELVNFPKEKFRSAFGFNSDKCLLRNNKKKKIDSDKESQDQGIKMQNTATSLPVDDKLEVKVAVNPTQSRRIKSQDQSPNLLPETRKLETKVSKLTIINDVILSKPTHIVSTTDLNDNSITHNNISKVTESTKKQKNYITNFDFYLSGADEGDNEDKLVSPSSDTSSNVWENVDDITANNLEMSNIWPALNVLDTTYPRPDGPTNNDNAEFMENLNKQFNYSPRRFTETLLTIIEESFVQSEQESEGLRRFLKKSDEAERFDDICMSTVVMSETSDQLTNVTNTDLHEPQEDSTQYMSFKKLTTSKVRAKTYRASVRLDIEGETSEIQRSKKINSINSSAEKKKYPKTPGFIKQRGRGKISPAHRQEVVTASSIRNSLRDQKNFRKIPEIIVHAATPQLQGKNRRMSIQSCDDGEYLTAESDSEESNNNKSEELTTMTSHESATVEIEEPVASSSRKLNMSSIAYHHQEWVQAYEKASKYQSVVHRSTTAQPKIKENHTKKLEKTWFQKLQRKRQQCLDLVEQHFEKVGEVDLSIEEQSPSECNSCKVTMKFINTLRACSAYLTCGMNMRDAFNATAKNKGYVSSLSMNIKKKNELRPHLSVVHHGRTKSSRKSFGKKNIRIASPGAKCLSPHSKSYLKRKSLEASKSPGVNSTSLRPVSELRKLFSPGKLAAGSRNLNKNLQDCSRNAALPERSKTQQKFKHVVSPIAQYIKGNEAT